MNKPKEDVVEADKVVLREEEEREVAHPTEQVENPIE